MAAYGIPEADIATVIGIDPKTLRRHYRRELDTGHIKANTRVAEFLFRKATTDGHQCVTAAIFWLKTRARWSVNPTPPPPEQPMDADTNIMDAARRIAFALELAASAKKVEPRTINVTPRKVDA